MDHPPRTDIRIFLVATLLLGLAGMACLSCDRKTESATRIDAAVEVPPKLDALQAAKKRGELRALVVRPSEEVVPRAGGGRSVDRARVDALAQHLGLDVRFVPVGSMDQALADLRAGRADLIATAAPSGKPVPGIVFCKAIAQAKELVVVAASVKRPPRTARALHKFKLLAGGGMNPTIRQQLQDGLEPAPDLVQPGSSGDVDALLDRIGGNKGEAAVVLSHQLDEYLTYRDDVQIAFDLGHQPLALAFSETAPELVSVADKFFAEYALAPHLHVRFAGDLKDIRKRGVIRVAMLNNAVAYFIYRGQQVGFQFDLAELLSMRLGIRLEIVVPERPGDLLRLLAEKRADLAVVTPNLKEELFDACAYTLPIDHSDQVLVQPVGQELIKDVAQLAGRTVHVRRSSQYFATLDALRAKVPTLKIVAAPEDHETEELIDQVAWGEIPLTVANSALLRVEKTYRDDIQGKLILARAKPLVFAVRKDSPRLLERLNRFVLKDCTGPEYQALLDRYFSHNRRMAEVRSEAMSESGSISPYDSLARKYGKKHKIDYRLLLAQMYQESRFDPRARSWAGAQGLMQVMPETGKELDLRNPWDPEQNVKAGTAYLARLIDGFDPTLPRRQRIRFALAAYNAGLGHVRDARRLARARGLDPNIWFGHVEKAIKLLEKRRFYARARHGYCRGSEPVQYVSMIQNKFDAYSRLKPTSDGG